MIRERPERDMPVSYTHLDVYKRQSTAGLSFLGLGVQPPVPEWGAMLSAGRQYIRDYWHVVTFPGIAIMLTVFSLNVFGDGLRDALDPRLKN